MKGDNFMSKIFGDFKNLHDLNETARNLRSGQEYDDLLVLGLENGVDEDTVKKFYEGDEQYLIQEEKSERKCRICGCTWNNACEGGCYWVEDDLCSKCAEDKEPVLKTTEKAVLVHNQAAEIEISVMENVPKIYATADVNTDATAVEKLKREAGTAKNDTVPTQPISKYLINKCEDDPEFAKFILIPHKTLEKCFKHIESEARKKLQNRTGWIDDNEVYGWAEDYYRLDDAEIERISAEKKKQDEERRKKENEKAKKEAATSSNKPNNIKTDAKLPNVKQVDSSKEKGKKNKSEDIGQISLFDFGGAGIE